MKRSFMAGLADEYIRRAHRISEKSVIIGLSDFNTDKNVYQIPKLLSFPRKVENKLYNGMQVFEMEPENGEDKVIMYIHGGGYINNFSVFHWIFLSSITNKGGYGFTAPNYPLLPKYTYKHSHEKMLDYYREYALTHDMNNVILAGDSAGGGFALALLQQVKELHLPLPSKVILISPFVDAKGANIELAAKDALVDFNAALRLGDAWANGADYTIPQISPLYGNLEGLPPINIYVGTYEILYDECVCLYNKLINAKNDVRIYIGEKMGHDFPLYPIPEGKIARKDIMDFIGKV